MLLFLVVKRFCYLITISIAKLRYYSDKSKSETIQKLSETIQLQKTSTKSSIKSPLLVANLL